MAYNNRRHRGAASILVILLILIGAAAGLSLVPQTRAGKPAVGNNVRSDGSRPAPALSGSASTPESELPAAPNSQPAKPASETQPPEAPAATQPSQAPIPQPSQAPTAVKPAERPAATQPEPLPLTQPEQPQSTQPEQGGYQPAEQPAPADQQPSAQPDLWVDVDLTRQLVMIKEGDQTVKTMVTSSGMPGYDTPQGEFEIQNRGEWFFSEKYQEGAKWWVSFKDWGIYLFHSVVMDENQEIIPEEAAKLGTPASHGCLRLAVEDAKWIYDNLPQGAKVVIHR